MVRSIISLRAQSSSRFRASEDPARAVGEVPSPSALARYTSSYETVLCHTAAAGAADFGLEWRRTPSCVASAPAGILPGAAKQARRTPFRLLEVIGHDKPRRRPSRPDVQEGLRCRQRSATVLRNVRR